MADTPPANHAPARPWPGPDSIPTIEGDAVTLRAMADGDIGFVEEVSADPHIPTFTTVPAEWSIAAGQAFIDRQKGRLAEGAGYPFAIVRGADLRVVGFIGIWFREIEKGHLTIGYFTAPHARRQGLTAIALKMISDWGFEALEPDRHRLYIEEWNIGSQRTGERAGFVHQPGISAREKIGDVWKDMLVWDRDRPTGTVSTDE